MKKLLTTILGLLSIGLSAQTMQITIYDLTPSELCPGDTLHVMFKWNNIPASYMQFNILPSPGGIGGQIASYNTNTFYSLPKTIVGSDTIYYIKIKTHTGHAIGQAGIGTDWINLTPFYFKKCTNGPRSRSQSVRTIIGNKGMTLEYNEGERPKKIIILD